MTAEQRIFGAGRGELTGGRASRCAAGVAGRAGAGAPGCKNPFCEEMLKEKILREKVVLRAILTLEMLL